MKVTVNIKVIFVTDILIYLWYSIIEVKKMTIGENIKRIRLEKGLTQKQLGKLCNPEIAESTIRRYELGKLNPKYETLERIASALDTHALVLNDSISEEYAKIIMNTDIDALTAFTAFIRNIYGYLDEKQVRIEEIGNFYYYVLGKGDDATTISYLTFDNLYEETEKLITETIKKYSMSEEDMIKEGREVLLGANEIRAKYGEILDQIHLTPIAAHNDNIDDPEQQKLMEEDLKDL